MDFTKITKEQMDAAVTKFRNAGAKIRAANSPASQALSYDEMALTPNIISTKQLKNTLLRIATKITTRPDDPIFGTSNYSFSVTNSFGKRISFTDEEEYLIFRAAYLERTSSEEYKNKLAKAKELKAYLDQYKSTDEKIKEAESALAALNIDANDL